jgi:glycosyltransferase involved in cell wall biosynthesis
LLLMHRPLRRGRALCTSAFEVTGSRVKALFIGRVWPEPDSSAAGVRSLQLVDIFQENSWSVFFSSPAKLAKPHVALLSSRNISTTQITANSDTFDSFLVQLSPDYVFFDTFVMEEQFGWRVRRALPKAVRIIDSQDLHFLRKARAAAVARGADVGEVAALSIPYTDENMLREVASIYRSHLTLVVSSYELELLRDRFGIPSHKVALAPFFYEPIREKGSDRDFHSRNHFFMLGNFRHPPNRAALYWTKHTIWPLIRGAVPHAQCHVYGSYPDREAMRLSDASTGFLVKGHLQPPLHPFLSSYRLNLAPLQFGAGVKGKIAEGWRAGVPSITTAIGQEGMTSNPGPAVWGGAVSNTREGLAEAASRLYCDRDAWVRAHEAGFALLRTLFHRPTNSALLMHSIGEAHRRAFQPHDEDLVAALLWHHRHRATEVDTALPSPPVSSWPPLPSSLLLVLNG